jgi:hypothetical protein
MRLYETNKAGREGAWPGVLTFGGGRGYALFIQFPSELVSLVLAHAVHCSFQLPFL